MKYDVVVAISSTSINDVITNVYYFFVVYNNELIIQNPVLAILGQGVRINCKVNEKITWTFNKENINEDIINEPENVIIKQGGVNIKGIMRINFGQYMCISYRRKYNKVKALLTVTAYGKKIQK